MEFSEDEVIALAVENNDAAKDIVLEKYSYIVEIMLKKYYNLAIKCGIDLKEFEQEAYYALSMAILNYREDKKAGAATFISLCIDRRLKKIIHRNSGEKAKIINNTFSLDYDYDEAGLTLKDVISDGLQFDPLHNLTEKEHFEELLEQIKDELSDSEYEIFSYLINGFDTSTIGLLTKKNAKQIDNAVQRIKHKLRDIIKDD